MTRNLVKPRPGAEPIRATREEIGWEHLDFHVLSLSLGDEVRLDTAARETAVVAISGVGGVDVDDESFELSRRGVFGETGGLVYVPPDASARLRAASEWCVGLGSAPATGLYPARLIEPGDVKVEVRGGGSALRQVNHLLAPPLPAERLIVYEVFVPAGSWAGWPPHRHDGVEGSPYLEETYFFRFDRPGGFGFHRNYSGDGAYDETFAIGDQVCVAVPRGFHVTTAAPGHNMWILNFLAGAPVADERARPPYYDPETTWITDAWSEAPLGLPVPAPARDR